ncbi:MAG: hypothetical protein RSB47_05160 [Ruthenibacterium sp.]
MVLGILLLVCGGFNHALCGAETAFASVQEVPAWICTLSDDDLADGFTVARADNVTDVATCRNVDMPYTAGVKYTSVLDDFIVSSNVKASTENVDLDFAYSDHNPVLLHFTLT